MTKLLLPSLLALSLVSGCKKKEASCDAVFDHTVSLMPAEMQAKVKEGKADAIAKCEKMSPEARKCALDAKALEDLMKCPHDGAAGKPTEATGATAPAAGSAPAGDFPAAFAAWNMSARQAAWQGAWAGDGDGAGVKAAWKIDGDKIDFFDKSGEKHMTLKLQSPCSAKLEEHGADGSTSSTITVFTLKDGQLITGLGDAGQKNGDNAVVCGGGKIFTVDAKGCTSWEDDFGKLSSKPGDCGFAKDAGKDIFRYTVDGHESKLIVEGDVIWSEQLSHTHATKQADLDAAKKAQGL
jgi:hypothetical protein